MISAFRFSASANDALPFTGQINWKSQTWNVEQVQFSTWTIDPFVFGHFDLVSQQGFCLPWEFWGWNGEGSWYDSWMFCFVHTVVYCHWDCLTGNMLKMYLFLWERDNYCRIVNVRTVTVGLKWSYVSLYSHKIHISSISVVFSSCCIQMIVEKN